MTKKPLIGITLDSRGPGGYSKNSWYAIRENYCSSIAKVGGIPFPLTHDLNLVEDYLSLIDGLLITGGRHDVDPLFYGASERHPEVILNPERTIFEMAMARATLKKNLPVLGICGGHQVLNVILGGTLIQHIPDEVSSCLEHVQKSPQEGSSHTVKIIKETFLHQVIGRDELPVNSTHHQAIKDLGNGLNVNAIAPDGIIEGIEAPQYKFCLGLQWHPEFLVTPQEEKIFKAFIEASNG
ncbi:MAG TPA: gamma-glutamyl-gamma-aminobutyrate hydrolase family protein [Alphaproteobacteria bacterium]|nr:gamma-glutamyl-gamma-aminobutyrate hydrolase family protein [Alphaproteobacteria bacterium]